jgi:hypothetical protein
MTCKEANRMIEHRPMTETATVSMPLYEYDKLKMDSYKYQLMTDTLFEHAHYDSKEDDLFFLFSVEEYVRSIIKIFEPERFEIWYAELKERHEEQEQEDF